MASLSPRPMSGQQRSSSFARSSSLSNVSPNKADHHSYQQHQQSMTRSHSSSTATSFLPQPSNFDINSAPQDYVLVDGQKFRVRRQRSFNNGDGTTSGMDAVATSVDSLEMSASGYHNRDEFGNSPLTLGGEYDSRAAARYGTNGQLQLTALQEQVESLKRSLSQAQQKIKDQSLEIEYKNEKIRQLETENHSLKSFSSANNNSSNGGPRASKNKSLRIESDADSSNSGCAFLQSSTAPPSLLAPQLMACRANDRDLQMTDYITPQATSDRKFFPTPSSAASGRSASSTTCTTANGSPDSTSSGAPETLSIGSRRGTASSIATAGTYQDEFDAATTPHVSTSPRRNYSASSLGSQGSAVQQSELTVRKSQSKMSSSRSKLGKFKVVNNNAVGAANSRQTPSPFQAAAALSIQHPSTLYDQDEESASASTSAYKQKLARSHDSSYEDPDRSFQGMTRSESYDFDGMLDEDDDNRSAVTAASGGNNSYVAGGNHRSSQPSPYGMQQQDLLISGPGDETPTIRNTNRKMMSSVNASNNNNSAQQLSASTNSLKNTLSSSMSNLNLSNAVVFQWKSHAQTHPQHPLPYIFIFHDNPQLTKTIASHITGVTGNSGKGSMEIIIESHESKENARFIFASIIFSGDSHEVEDADVSLSGEPVRGGNCLIACNLRAVQGNLKHFPTRPSPTKPDIIELDFSGKDSTGSSVKAVDISSPDKVSQFLSACHARVDIVLDPYHDGQHRWYPYYEGSRKMAPQFRSKGIGYVRLGDDMSNYGSAFMSLDAGKTYLDNNNATNIIDRNAMTLTGPLTLNKSGPLDPSVMDSPGLGSNQSKKADTLRKMVKNNRGAESPNIANDVKSLNSTGGSAQGKSPRRSPSSNTGVSDESISKSVNRIHELLQVMEQQGAFSTGAANGNSMKWSEKVDNINKLAAIFMELSPVLDRIFTVNTGSNQSTVLVNLLSKLLDMFTKQSNPNVTIAVIKLLQCFADCSMLIATTTYSLPWRSLVVELFYAMRSTNKSIHDNALTALTALHEGFCLPWTLIAALMGDIVVGGRGNGGSAAGGDAKKKVGTTSVTTAANTFKILTWFQQSLIQDLKMLMTNLDGEVLDLDMIDCFMICKNDFVTFTSKVYSVVSHREEQTREMASNLLATLFMTEVFQMILTQSYSTSAGNGGYPSIRTIAKQLETLVAGRPTVDSEALQAFVCEETAQLMKEMKVATKGVSGGLSSSKLLDKMNGSITTCLKLCWDEMKGIAGRAPPTPKIAARSAAVLGATASTNPTAPNSARGAAKKLSPSLSRAASFKGNSEQLVQDTETEDVSTIQENMRILKSRSSSARSRGVNARGSPRPSDPTGAIDGSPGSNNPTLNSLSGKWYEIKLLFKTVPSSDEHWNHAVKVNASS